MTSSVPTARVSPSLITFVTGAEWTAQDLVEFISAVETLYGLLFALHWIGVEAESVDGRRDGYFLAMELREHLSAPAGFEVGDLWRANLALRSFPSEQAWLLDQLHTRLYERTPRAMGKPDDAVFRMFSIRMSSPGKISFEGLGEIVRELREFVKDVWWRNSHERRMADIELYSKEIELAHDFLKLDKSYQRYVASPGKAIDRATITLAGALHQLLSLESRDKLRRRPDALSALPDDVDP